MPIAILLQTLSRTFLWILLISLDMVGPLIFSFNPQGHWVYVTLAAVTVLAFLYTYFFEEDGVLRDIREICVYGVFVHCLALGLYLSAIRTDLIHIALMAALALLKYARLVWPCKSPQGDNFAAWPVFGILGWLNRHNVSNEGDSKPTRRQALAVYILLLICLLVGCLISYASVELKLAYFCVIPLFILPYLYKRTRAEIIEQDARYRIAQEASSKAKAQAEAAQFIALEKEKMNAELAEMNTEIKEAYAHAERVSRALRDIGHDLRSPIHVMGFVAQEIVRAPDAATRELALQEMQAAKQFVLTTMEKSLLYAKIATKMARPKIQAIDLGAILLQFQRTMRHAAKAKGIQEIKVLPFQRNSWRNRHPLHHDKGPVGPFIASDDGLLMRIVQNIIGNTISHAGPCRQITLSMRRRGGHIWLQVWDQGVGIADADGLDGVANFAAFAKRIFEATHDWSSETTSHGMGINIVKQVSDIAQFAVTLRSRQGRGTVFGVMLPLADAALIAQQLTEEMTVDEKMTVAQHFQQALYVGGAALGAAK